ncbi:hypothetical protein [Lentzea flava]|uniref:Uncharacterized protein n=1 Tax=Lentzea flava TaxID=103732 RepID=A0ABQ2ULS0_9PSEU|nr:hypothetical protein [Lentzea flava]MCP2200598.1 hypothetical protein [Lentzea flava]GGU43827.1 hypothetical protein GCM10010178_40490 [Lentzea flava]
MRKASALGALIFATAVVTASPANASPLVSVGDVHVGDVTVAPQVVIGDVDVFEDVLEHVNIAALWGQASSLVTEGPGRSR